MRQYLLRSLLASAAPFRRAPAGLPPRCPWKREAAAATAAGAALTSTARGFPLQLPGATALRSSTLGPSTAPVDPPQQRRRTHPPARAAPRSLAAARARWPEQQKAQPPGPHFLPGPQIAPSKPSSAAPKQRCCNDRVDYTNVSDVSQTATPTNAQILY